MSKPKALTPKQRRFVEEYLIDHNATQAAIRAGYSEHTADRQGSRLLKNVEVAAAVATRSEKVTEKADVTTEDIVSGLKKEAEREDEGSSHAARVSAWSHLGKYRGMFTDRSEVSGRIEVVIRSE
jgi:phage terminase small subunit